MTPSSSRLFDVIAGAAIGVATTGAGAWVAAAGAGVPEEAVTSLVGGWSDDGAMLILPGWARVALGLGVAAAGLVIVWGVAHEASRRFRRRQPQASVSSGHRSVAGLVLSVWTGAFFSLVGGILVLASAGVIPSVGGGEPGMPWLMGVIGATVGIAASLVTYSSVYRWMGGTGTRQRRA